MMKKDDEINYGNKILLEFTDFCLAQITSAENNIYITKGSKCFKSPDIKEIESIQKIQSVQGYKNLQEEKKDITIDLLEYQKAENNCKEELKKLPQGLQKEAENIITDLLYEHFYISNSNIEFKKQILLSILRQIPKEMDFTNYLLSFVALKNQREIQQKIEEIVEEKYEKIKMEISIIANKTKTEKLPDFLYPSLKDFIRQSLLTQWRINCDNPQKKTYFGENQDDFQFLYDRFSDFYDDRMNFFDLKYLDNNQELPLLIFKALFYSNQEYFIYPYNLKNFVNNAKDYLFLMGVNEKYINYTEILQNCLDKKDNLENVIKKLKEIIKGDKLKILFIIFNISAMLNHIAEVSLDDHGNKRAMFSPSLKCSAKERHMLNNFVITFQKYFFENLGILGNEDYSSKNYLIQIEALLENYVFSSIIKSYERALFDENHKIKGNINYLKVLDLIDLLDENNATDFMNKYEHIDLATLNQIDRKNLYELYLEFKENFMNIKCEAYLRIKKKTFIQKTWKNTLSGMTKGVNKLKNIMGDKPNKEIEINIKNSLLTLFYPLDPINSSINITIFVHGFYLTEEYFNYNRNRDLLYNLVNKDKYSSRCYYIYNWQDSTNIYNKKEDSLEKAYEKFTKGAFKAFKSLGVVKSSNTESQETIEKMEKKFREEQKQIEYHKKYSSLYGKLLAFILSSRQLFKFHTISLVGIGLGCNVIKHCLKQMGKINEQLEVGDIIEDVVMIGGITKIKEKHLKALEIISGKFINAYNSSDNNFKVYFNGEKDLVGTGEISKISELSSKNKSNNPDKLLLGTDREYLPEIVNLDLSDLMICNMEEYLAKIDIILKKIGFN